MREEWQVQFGAIRWTNLTVENADSIRDFRDPAGVAWILFQPPV